MDVSERELEVTVYRLREENGRLHLQVKALQQELYLLRSRPIGYHNPPDQTNGHLNGIAEEDEGQGSSDTEKSTSQMNGHRNETNTGGGGSSGYQSNGFLDESTDSNNSNRTFDSSSPETGTILQDTVEKLQRELVMSKEALSGKPKFDYN